MKIEYVKIEDLQFDDYNPRKATVEQFEQLKNNLTKFGFVEPVLVNSNAARKNVIIGGHFRVRTAKELGYKEVPVVYVDIADIEKEKELNVRLNRNTGSFDYTLLKKYFDIGDLVDWGFEAEDFEIGGRGTVDSDNMAKGLESFMNADKKQIVLFFKGTEYDDMVARITAVQADFALDDFSGVFLKLLERYENNENH